MRNKKVFNLVLMLGILVVHTFTLSYWLSNETQQKLNRTESRLNFESRNTNTVLKADTNVQKSINSSASLRQ